MTNLTSAPAFFCDATPGSCSETDPNREAGFSLVEVSIAMVIILVALLGIFSVFTYAIQYNAGNKSRAQALAVLQQEVERYRSAKFTSTFTDSYAPTNPDNGTRDITGGTKAARIVTPTNGRIFRVNVVVDNDPLTAGIQGEAVPTALKEIEIRVTLASPSPGWQTAVPATIVMRRVRGN